MSVEVRRANAGTNETIVPIMGDGNCFFRAVLHALALKNISPFVSDNMQDAHRVLRNLVVDMAEGGGYSFIPFEMEHDSKAEWLAAMRLEGTWADTLAVRITSDVLGVPIMIHGPNNQPYVTMGEGYTSFNFDTMTDNVIRLRLQYLHYDVMV